MSDQEAAGGSAEQQPELVENETSNTKEVETSPRKTPHQYHPRYQSNLLKEAAAESSTTSQPACQNCNKSSSELDLSKCTKCKSVSYCSKDCQKKDFKAHKKVCPRLAQEWSLGMGNIKMATRSSGAGRVREKGIGKWEYDT